jgi:hypothetical protein
MKSRPEPSPAPVTYTGLCNPEEISVSLNELLSGTGPLGVASAGLDAGVGAGVEIDGVGLLAGGAFEVVTGPLHPAITNPARQITETRRTLRQV